VAVRRILQALVVVVTAIAAFGGVFGWSVRDAVDIACQYHGSTVRRVGLSASSSVGWAVFAALVAGVAVLALRGSNRWWPGSGQWVWTRHRAGWAVALGATGLSMLCLALGDSVLSSVLDRWALLNHVDAVGISTVGQVAGALQAGIGEEVIVLAIPAAVLRFYRAPTVLALCVLVALRVSYHLYYGWIGVVWLVPWAVVTAAVYWRWPDWRLLVLLVVDHAVFDLRSLLFGRDAGMIWLLAGVSVLAVAGAIRPRWWAAAASSAGVSVRIWRRRGAAMDTNPISN